MKKNIIICVAFLTILFIVRCGQSNQDDTLEFVKEFPRTTNLYGDVVVSANKMEYSMSGHLTVLDTFLVILCPTEKAYIDVYSTNSHDLIGEFSSKGRGPGEFNIATAVRGVTDAQGNFYHVYDVANMMLTRVDLGKSIIHGEYSYEQRRMDYLGQPTNVDKIYHIGDVFIAYKEDGQRVSLFNSKTKEKNHIPYNYPKPTFAVKDDQIPSLFFSHCVLNSKTERIALAPMHLGQLDLYKSDGKHIKTVMYCDYDELRDSMQELHDLNNTNPKIFAQDVVSNEDYIFVLNLNATYSKIETGTISKSEVLVFDWNGNPVEKFVLDRLAGGIAIDFSADVIYAICPFEEDYPIVRYSFSLR